MTDPRLPEENPDSLSGTLVGLLRHSLIYSLVPFIRQAVSLGMNRLYTAWLLTAKYGVKENVDIWMIAGQQLMGQNLLGGMVRFYFEQKDERDRRAVVSSCTLLLTAVAWTVCGLSLFFSDDLTPILLGRGNGDVSDVELRTVLELMLVLIPFQLSSLCGLYYLQILKRSDLYSGIQVAKLLIEIALNFVLMGHYQLGVQGFLLSMLAGEVLVNLSLTIWMLRRVGLHFDGAILRPILSYALPLIPVGLCQTGLHQLDRRLLEGLSEDGFEDAGVYGLGYKLGYLVTAMMLGPFLQIWQPWIFGVRDAEERSRLVARVSTYTVIAVASLSLLVILFGRQGILVLSGDQGFRWAFQVVPWLVLSYVFWALYHATQIPLLIAKRTRRLLVINVVALAVNISLNVVLIPRYDILGASLATLASFGLLGVLGVLASYSEAHVPFEWRRIASAIVCVLVGAVATFFLDWELAAAGDWDFFSGTPTRLVLLVVLEAWLLLAILTREERGGILGWLRSRMRGAAPPAD